MTVQIKDSDGTVRLSGDLLAAGGAAGDVLTQQADGTYAPAAVVLTTSTHITSADILAGMKALVVSPGPTTSLFPVGALVQYNAGSTPYAGGGGFGVGELKVGPDPDVGAYWLTGAFNILASATDKADALVLSPDPMDLAAVVGAGLAFCTSQPVIDGDGTLDLTLCYTVRT